MLNDAHNLMAACGSLDPIFVLPVSSTLVEQHDASPETRVAGRKTGTGSAAISSPVRRAARRADIVGFRKTSLLRMIMSTGNTPLDASSGNYSSLEEIRRKASRPLVVFPECTTSNGRGLLRFAEVFRDRVVPVKGYKVFIMCIRYVCAPRLMDLEFDTISVTIRPRSCPRHCPIPFRRR
jgi:hypothetical protein